MSEGSKKRKKRFYNSGSAKRSKYALNLSPGLKGFLITHNGHPKFCIREAYNLLDEFSSQNNSDNAEVLSKEDSDDDFEAELKKDIEKTCNESKDKEFQVVETGVTGCVFIRANNVEPLEIMGKVIQKIIDSGKCQSRKVLRMLPIEITCKAYLEDIKKAIGPLLDTFFKGDARTYAIIVNRRNNSNILREELIRDLGLMIRDRSPFHSADLKKPQLTVLVEILKSVCCLAVVTDYNKHRKYNLVELGLACQGSNKDVKAGGKSEDSDVTANNQVVELKSSLNEDLSTEVKSDVPTDKIPNGKDSVDKEKEKNGISKDVSEDNEVKEEETKDVSDNQK